MTGGARPRWFLDACVLYPQLTRGILLGAGEAGLIVPFWSPRVLDEWRIAAARAGGMTGEAEMRRTAEAMIEAFPAALVDPDPDLAAILDLPDRADIHVAAGARAADAVVLTFNIRDFPARRLAPHGIAVEHPDGALWALFSEAPEALAPAIRTALAALTRPGTDTGRSALKRAGLPRFGKAWAASGL